MKASCLMVIYTLLSCVAVCAQELQPAKKLNSALMLRSHVPGDDSFDSPLYVITIDNKELQIPENGNLKDSISIAESLFNISTSRVQSISVLKENDALAKYESLAQNGVVLIALKNGSIEKMSSEFSKRFKEK